jgi:hypothetical protein
MRVSASGIAAKVVWDNFFFFFRSSISASPTKALDSENKNPLHLLERARKSQANISAG